MVFFRPTGLACINQDSCFVTEPFRIHRIHSVNGSVIESCPTRTRLDGVLDIYGKPFMVTKPETQMSRSDEHPDYHVSSESDIFDGTEHIVVESVDAHLSCDGTTWKQLFSYVSNDSISESAPMSESNITSLEAEWYGIPKITALAATQVYNKKKDLYNVIAFQSLNVLTVYESHKSHIETHTPGFVPSYQVRDHRKYTDMTVDSETGFIFGLRQDNRNVVDLAFIKLNQRYTATEALAWFLPNSPNRHWSVVSTCDTSIISKSKQDGSPIIKVTLCAATDVLFSKFVLSIPTRIFDDSTAFSASDTGSESAEVIITVDAT